MAAARFGPRTAAPLKTDVLLLVALGAHRAIVSPVRGREASGADGPTAAVKRPDGVHTAACGAAS